MDESALRIALASANDCGSLLQQELRFWTCLVVVGVALELVVIFWEYREELHEFRRGLVHPPDKPNWLLYALGFFAAGLVALGVGGELQAESKIATVETCIRQGNDALSLLLSREASEAKERAEELKAENLKLEALIQPRSLSLEQQRAIGKMLRTFPRRHVRIASFSSDPEAYVLSAQIVAALHCAQVDVTDMSGKGNGGYAKETGVAIFSSTANKPFAEAIRRALSSLGKLKSVKLIVADGKPTPDPAISITVLAKPLDVLGKTAGNALACKTKN